ncbi:unnamed protein product [Ixodes persulcatus]
MCFAINTLINTKQHIYTNYLFNKRINSFYIYSVTQHVNYNTCTLLIKLFNQFIQAAGKSVIERTSQLLTANKAIVLCFLLWQNCGSFLTPPHAFPSLKINTPYLLVPDVP